MENLYLEHHGIMGQHWGIRRYQNSDGTLTAEGKKKYKYGTNKDGSIKSKKTHTLETNGAHKNAVAASRKQDAWKQTRNSYAKNQSFGKKAAKFVLVGPFGMYTYNSLRAAGNDRLVSGAATIASQCLAGPLGNVGVSIFTGANYKNTYMTDNNKYNYISNTQKKAH